MKLDKKIITIDGPSASGKGVLSSSIANHLNFSLLDSGLLYRAYAYSYQSSLDHETALKTLQSMNFVNTSNELSVNLDGNEITKELRSESMAKIASEISMIPETRKNLISIQRSFKNDNGLIADGRDMGTVVFPEAGYKIFLTANPKQRAIRRFKELKSKGQDVNLHDLTKDIMARDEADSQRSMSPLTPAKDAIIINTSEMSKSDVFKKVMHYIKHQG